MRVGCENQMLRAAETNAHMANQSHAMETHDRPVLA